MQTQEALKCFSIAEELEPEYTQAQYQKQLVLQSLDRYEEALQVLLHLVKLAPREAEIYHHIGMIYKRFGNKEETLQNWMKSLDLDPKDPF